MILPAEGRQLPRMSPRKAMFVSFWKVAWVVWSGRRAVSHAQRVRGRSEEMGVARAVVKDARVRSTQHLGSRQSENGPGGGMGVVRLACRDLAAAWYPFKPATPSCTCFVAKSSSSRSASLTEVVTMPKLVT